jgi:tetratricopeptide (TPR) repeat protein
LLLGGVERAFDRLDVDEWHCESPSVASDLDAQSQGVIDTVTGGTFTVTPAMSDGTGETLLDRARALTAAGDWHRAYDLLVEADNGGLLPAADLPLLAEVAYAAGHLDVTIEMWERAYAEAVRAEDHQAAAGAAVRVAMHLLLDTALMAPVRGWLSRAERLLGARGATPVEAWLAVVRSHERMLTGDVHGAKQWARRAIDIGAGCDPAAAAIGRVALARSLILDGEVQEGLALLDEAGVATVSGELDSLSTGVVYCELVCALQGLAHYDLAEEWTEAMERWRQTSAIGSLHGRCRVHRAEILRLRGACDEAEQEALLACEELRPFLRRELGWPLSELGRIRLRRGDIHGAEHALLAARDAGWDPQPGLALVRLAQGDVASAAASIRDALENPTRVPSKELPPNTELRRVPLLEAQVEIEVAAGGLERARAAAEELEGVAGRFGSKALVASTALAYGRVRLAEGASADAERHFEEAARLWHDVGAPYEAAVSRVGLAEAHRARGDADRADSELRAARVVLERIRAIHQADRVPPLAAIPERDQQQAARRDVFRREGDYWSLSFEGSTVRVRDLKGMRYLARLLADPGREFHVLDLVAAERGQTPAVGRAAEPGLPDAAFGDAGPLLDARAKEAYRRRLAEIEDDMGEALAMGDEVRAAQADVERDLLIRELTRAVGLGGRDRRAAAASERARASVTRALRQAIARIHEHHPTLGTHLDRSIRTGTYCAYLPDSRGSMKWKT